MSEFRQFGEHLADLLSFGAVFANVATIYPGSFLNPFTHYIHVSLNGLLDDEPNGGVVKAESYRFDVTIPKCAVQIITEMIPANHLKTHHLALERETLQHMPRTRVPINTP